MTILRIFSKLNKAISSLNIIDTQGDKYPESLTSAEKNNLLMKADYMKSLEQK